MKRDDNLQYVYDELQVMAETTENGGVVDLMWLNTVMETLRVFAEENHYWLEEME